MKKLILVAFLDLNFILIKIKRIKRDMKDEKFINKLKK